MMTTMFDGVRAPTGEIDARMTHDRRAGQRGDFRRARKINWPVGSVVTDGAGNIKSRPLQRHLPCFADVVEWLMGKWDVPTVYDGHEQAYRCGGCPVAAWCGKIAQERIAANAELRSAHAAWIVAIDRLAPEDRYRGSAWVKVVDAYEAACFADSNVDAIKADDERSELERRRKRSAAAKAKRKASKRERQLKKIPITTVAKIAAYRDDRLDEMKAAKLGPKPPLWLRNRSPERAALIANAWAAREMVEAAGARASGRAVAQWLEENNHKPADEGSRFTKAVEEALARADKLIADGTWPEFEERRVKPRSCGRTMHPDVIHTLLD